MQSSVEAIEKKVNTRRAGGVIDADRHSVGNGFVLPLTSMSCPECMPTGDKDCNDNNDDDRILSSVTGGVTTTFSHNNRGELASKTVPGTGTTEYTFNAAGELRKIEYPDDSSSVYDYDPFSIRKRKTEKDDNGDITDDTRYFYADLNGLPRIISEEKLFGGDPRFTHYAYAQELLLRDVDGEITYFIVGDNINVIALADESGAITDRYEYTPYGSLLSHTGTDPNRILFSSEPNDEKNRLVYLRRRYYSKVRGRFISKDNQFNIGTNLYTYCNNKPIDRSDNYGLARGELNAEQIVAVQFAIYVFKAYGYRYWQSDATKWLREKQFKWDDNPGGKGTHAYTDGFGNIYFAKNDWLKNSADTINHLSRLKAMRPHGTYTQARINEKIRRYETKRFVDSVILASLIVHERVHKGGYGQIPTKDEHKAYREQLLFIKDIAGRVLPNDPARGRLLSIGKSIQDEYHQNYPNLTPINIFQ